MKLRFLRFLCAAASFFLVAGAVQAAPITFIYTGSGSGTLDGTPFGASGPATFIIIATGLTEQREPTVTPGFSIDHITALIEIIGLGTFEFISPTRTYSTSGIGFGRVSMVFSDLYSAPGTNGAGWDMLTSFGAVGGTNGSLLQWANIPVETTGGVLFFENRFPVAGSFEAIVGVSETPIPAALPLFATGLGALGLITHRRKQRGRRN